MSQYIDQQDQAWNNLEHWEQERLRKAVKLLCEARHSRLSDTAALVWCKSLAPYAKGQLLWTTMRTLCEATGKPSIAEIKTAMRGRPELNQYQPPKKLTPEEQKKSDLAAVMSMLWLHYEHGWQAKDFSWKIFERVFEREGADAETILAGAREAFSRETIAKWMRDQEAAGN